jgi:uncharacterized protein with von Willebrand factor type A (vWA) domain
MTPTNGSALGDNVLAFGRLLRAVGVPVSASQSRDALGAAAVVGVARRADLRHALRATLVSRAADLPTFEAAFKAFWQDHGERWGRRDLRSLGDPHGTATLQVEVVVPETDAVEPPDVDANADGGTLPTGELRTWSGADSLRDQDFADVTSSELAQIRAALAALAWEPGRRRTRRWVTGPGPRLDLRRIWREQVRHGEAWRMPTRRRITRPRPLVLLVDVSGSMERYSRMLLHFAYTLRRARGRVEVFTFSTRLTRVTRALERGSIDTAVTAVSRLVPDWSGGTRIGDALRAFHVRWARSVLSRRPVVLVVSDGWDRGDPAMLQQQVARLQRSCHRLIWLSPLLGTADYRPLTRGLVAALPFVDDFLPARTLANLEDLAAHLNRLPGARPLRRQWQPGG